jgi:hypothetical protein
MGQNRKKDQPGTFAEAVEQTALISLGGDPMEIRSPIRDRRFVDERGAVWLIRRGELRWIRVERLIRDPDVPVLRVCLDELGDVPTSERENLLTTIRPYLKSAGEGRAPDDHTDFVAAEFKGADDRSMLIIEESC